MSNWYEKYIGQTFIVDGEEKSFYGTCENPNTKTGMPLQYVFEPGNVVVEYKEAKEIMTKSVKPIKGQMKKYRTATTIELPRSNHAKCPIYELDGKYYIKCNKPNTEPYRPFVYNGEKYAEVKVIIGNDGSEFWHIV